MEESKHKPIILYTLSVVIPAVVILAALAGLNITPFGDNSLAISDGDALYINYLGYVGRALSGKEGILFSFEKGLGGNMMGSWGWFLLNPFFVLFASADIMNYMQIYTFVSLLNFCVCGLTMYILLKDIYGHKSSNLIFSTAYALNGFLVANVFQVNFFAVIPALPIMALGLRRILNDQNPLIYILSVAYSLLMNFYFGFMLCAASVLFFLVSFLTDQNDINHKKTVVVKYAISSIIAGAISAVVWLPAILSLRGGRLDQSVVYSISLQENMPFLDMFSKFFSGANSTAELRNGLPNLFVGILPVFLVIVFYSSRRIDRRKKAASAVLLLFYLVSFFVPVLNIAMHGGTTTNWFNYRDSFVFCFLMLMIAAEEWEHILYEPGRNLKRAATILLFTALIVFDKRFEFVSGVMVLLDFAILALMLLAYWMHKNNPMKNPKTTMTKVVLLLMCVNLFLNYYFSTKSVMEWSHKESEYRETVLPVSAMIEAVHNTDDSFYRMEIGEQRSGNCGNDPMLYGYYGVGHGGSDDRNFVRTTLSELGIHRFDMRNSYGPGVPAATDTLLGLKYIISKDDLAEEKGYENVINLEGWGIYKNSSALPIGILVDDRIDSVEIDLENIFDNLNNAWSAMTSSQKEVFIEEEGEISFSSHNVSDSLELNRNEAKAIVTSRDASLSAQYSSEGEDTFLSDNISDSSSDSASEINDNLGRGTLHEKPENMNYIMFSFKASRDGAVYSYNRSGITEVQGSVLPALNYEGFYHKGDEVIGYLPLPSTVATEYLLEEVAGRFKVAYADADVLEELSQTILCRPSEIKKESDRFLRGEFTAEAGQKLMFTIPYDEGWTCYVDGKEVPISMVLDVFMAVDAPEGTHSYTMKFVPTGLKAGVVISSIGLIGIIFLLIYNHLSKKYVNGNHTDETTLPERYVGTINLGSEIIEDPQKPVNNTLKDNPAITVTDENEISKGIAVLVLVVVALIISLKSAHNLFLPYNQSVDSAVFEYVGRLMGRGGVMYRDTFDHKGPLLYFINWAGTRISGGSVGIGVIELGTILTTLILTYYVFRQFTGKSLAVVGAASIILAGYQYFESGNTVEEYALPFIIGGLYIFTRFFLKKNISGISVGICGFCLGCVLLLRENMVALWIVFSIGVIVSERKNPRRFGVLILQFLVGMLVAFLPAFLYLVANHALSDFIDQYILFNFRYSDISFVVRLQYIIGWGKLPGVAISLVISVILLLTKYDRKYLCAINLMYQLLNIVFIGIAGTGFSHYGLMLIPGYVLTLAMLLDHIRGKIKHQYTVSLAIIAFIALMIPWIRFSTNELQEKYNNRYKNAESVAAAMIWDNTDPDDQIIVCGNADRIYIESERESASKYSYQLPIGDKDPKIFVEFLEDLEKNEPEVLVIDSYDLGGILDYTNLNKVVDQYLKDHTYYKWGEMGGITVFGRKELKTTENAKA